MKFFIVQPYGRDEARESTVVYEAATAVDGFAEVDRLAEQMEKTGARPDSIEPLVVESGGRSSIGSPTDV